MMPARQAKMGHRPSILQPVLLALILVLTVRSDDGDVVVITRTTPFRDMIDASWDLLSPSENVSRYQVEWQNSNGNTYLCFVNYPNSSTTDCIVRPTLYSCTYYNITVAPYNGPQPTVQTPLGRPDWDFNATLLDGAVEITNLNCSSPGNESIFVTWHGPGDCIEYSVTYTGYVSWGAQEIIQGEFKTHSVGTTLLDVVPYTHYVVAVDAYNQTNDPGICEVDTPQDEPSAPMNLTVTRINDASIHVSWNGPEKENGVLGAYYVLLFNNDEGIFAQETNETSLVIEELDPCGTYVVSVAASTEAGIGAYSLQDYEDEVYKNPRVSCLQTISRETLVSSIYITWETNCAFDEINLFYTTYVIWSGENDTATVTISAFQNFYEIEFPVPYSNYIFEVKGRMTEGIYGSASGTCQLLTHEGQPSQPRNLTTSQNDFNSIFVQWVEPERLNGVIRSYTIRWNDNVLPQKTHIDANELQSVYSYTIFPVGGNTSYGIDVWANTEFRGQSAYSGIRTQMPASASKDKLDDWAIVVASVAGTLVFMLLGIAFVKRDYIRKKMNSRKKTSIKTSDSSRTTENMELRNATLLQQTLRSIFKLENKPGHLEESFQQLNVKSRNAPCDVATEPQNLVRNRNQNAIPFDGSRVVLKSNKEMAVDYINASYVKDATARKKFVVSQGPSNETVADFWQMVWQEEVKVIAMLTKLEEGGQEACSQYWPGSQNTSATYGKFSVTFCAESPNGSFTQRVITLRNNEEETQIMIKQLHFATWPQLGTPATLEELQEFLALLRGELGPEEPVLLHSSSGAGRPGTLITLWNLQQRLEMGQAADVHETILKIREDRKHLVETKDQYLYVFKSLARILGALENVM